MAADPLEPYLRHYRELAAQVGEIGWCAVGSVVERYTYCGKPGCRCQADPPQPHGPYYQLTRKIAAKTVTRRLSPDEAASYKQWVANDHRLRQIVAEIEQVSAQAIEIILLSRRS